MPGAVDARGEMASKVDEDYSAGHSGGRSRGFDESLSDDQLSDLLPGHDLLYLCTFVRRHNHR